MSEPTDVYDPDDLPELPDTQYDPETLRESFAEDVSGHRELLHREIRSAPDETGELLARGDLVDLLRIRGDLDEARDEALAAVDRAEIAGTAAQQHLARLRLARVHQWRGEFVDANPLFTELLNAAGQFGAVIEAFTFHDAGENDADQGHWEDAVTRFARALEIRDRLELDEAERSRVALDTARRRRDEAGS